MRRVTVITFFTFVAHGDLASKVAKRALVEDVTDHLVDAVSHTAAVDGVANELVDELVDELFDQPLQQSSTKDVDLESDALGKPGHLEAPSRTGHKNRYTNPKGGNLPPPTGAAAGGGEGGSCAAMGGITSCHVRAATLASSQQVQEKLRNDPEIGPIFKEMENDPKVAMRYYDDQAFLAKIRQKLEPETAAYQASMHEAPTTRCQREAAAIAQSKEVQQKLRNDPELKPIFLEMEKARGKDADKYYSDHALQAKIRERLQAEVEHLSAPGGPCDESAASTGPSNDMQETIDKLKADPELKPMLEKFETGSPEEVRQLYNDEKFLAKIRERMGDSQIPGENPKTAIMNLPPSCQSIAASVIRSKEMQEKIQKLKYDPELQSAFLEMEKGGPADMMKYYNNNEFLNKVRARLGDVPEMNGCVVY